MRIHMDPLWAALGITSIGTKKLEMGMNKYIYICIYIYILYIIYIYTYYV
jgi:hypothetical protein